MRELPSINFSEQTCLITGATSGIGFVAAREMARLGATVVGVGRNQAKNESAVAAIRSEVANARVEYLLADLSILSDVRRLGDEIDTRYASLNILVNNAGAFFNRRNESRDGLEMTFALNHLAPFLLTTLLLEKLKASAPARIITVSSGAHFMGRIRLHDLQMKRGYNGWGAYGMSKLANVMFTYALARRLESTPAPASITANCLHPGFVASEFGKNNGKQYTWDMALMTPWSIPLQHGAQICLYLAPSPEVARLSGRYFDHQQHDLPSANVSYDIAQQERLWEVSTQLTGLA